MIILGYPDVNKITGTLSEVRKEAFELLIKAQGQTSKVEIRKTIEEAIDLLFFGARKVHEVARWFEGCKNINSQETLYKIAGFLGNDLLDGGRYKATAEGNDLLDGGKYKEAAMVKVKYLGYKTVFTHNGGVETCGQYPDMGGSKIIKKHVLSEVIRSQSVCLFDNGIIRVEKRHGQATTEYKYVEPIGEVEDLEELGHRIRGADGLWSRWASMGQVFEV